MLVANQKEHLPGTDKKTHSLGKQHKNDISLYVTYNVTLFIRQEIDWECKVQMIL